MADIRAGSYNNLPNLGANAGVYQFREQRSAMPQNDVLIFGTIHAGAYVYDWAMRNTASSASTTMSIGFRNADGTATSPVNGDHATLQIPGATYFLAATSIAAAAITRAGAPGTVANRAGMPIKLQKDILIIGTLGGAAIATDTIIELFFNFEHIGIK